MKLKVTSLFSGCRAMDLSIQGNFEFIGKHFEELPFEVFCAADNDSYATEIYNSNFEHQCKTQDVRDIELSKIPDHDNLMGSFPCQSFSLNAQNPPRLGYKDDRGKLFFEMVNVLKEKQPRFFIDENVKGLLSANKRQAFPMLVKKIKKAGYYIYHKFLNATEFGVRQKNVRVFNVGFREFDVYFNFSFPKPITLNGSKVKLKQDIDPQADQDENWFFILRAVKGMLQVRGKMNKSRVQVLEQLCCIISSHLAKVSLNGTAPVLMVDGKNRRFTPTEAGNIQSSPQLFKLDVVSENRQFRAIGNAVPPVLMWHVAKALIKCCFEN